MALHLPAKLSFNCSLETEQQPSLLTSTMPLKAQVLLQFRMMGRDELQARRQEEQVVLEAVLAARQVRV